jgi:hypothetical protein
MMKNSLEGQLTFYLYSPTQNFLRSMEPHNKSIGQLTFYRPNPIVLLRFIELHNKSKIDR